MEPWLDELLAVGRWDLGAETAGGFPAACRRYRRCLLRPERLATAFDSIAAEFKAANVGLP